MIASLDVLRASGWAVAVHNDYRLNGNRHTFWLLTHPSGRYVKGEGPTDEVALDECLKQIDRFSLGGAIGPYMTRLSESSETKIGRLELAFSTYEQARKYLAWIERLERRH
jgi:hypothetical protein